jgi:hypothetical protein
MREARREGARDRNQRREEEDLSSRKDFFSQRYPFRSPHHGTSRNPWSTKWMAHAEIVSETVRVGRRLRLLRTRLQSCQNSLGYLDIRSSDQLSVTVDKLGDMLNGYLETSQRIEREMTRVAHWEWDSCPSKPESLVNCEIVSDIVESINSLTSMVSTVDRGVDELSQLWADNGSGIPSYEFGAAKLRFQTMLSRALADEVTRM